MATDLSEFLSTHKQKGFRPIPHYCASGDYMSLYFRDERCHAKQVDEFLTVYRSMEAGGEVVGCEITGVRKILEAASSFGVHLNASKATIGFLLLVGLTLAKDNAHRQIYFDLRDMVNNIQIDELHLA